jgi:hypothetical protein
MCKSGGTCIKKSCLKIFQDLIAAAQQWAQNARESAEDALESETNAAASATSAANSASAASTSETNAAVSASAASTSATNASNSASAAATSATSASNSASSASTSATNAASSASAAATSALSAEASFDSFDDRYLGPKPSNPTTDNDGNPLLAGALYWNTTYGEMAVWTGTEWCMCKDKFYAFALDSTLQNVWYRGYILKSIMPPPPADPYAASGWEIEKTVLTIVGGNDILTTTYATGAWNNRESLIYT